MVKLSIIIPYFETYELTIKLFKELAMQQTDEVEIIIIDDGCHEYRLDRFDKFEFKETSKVIHKENEGVARSRNLGIKTATGKYIAFIDCDDMITNDYVERLLDAINNCEDVDIINFNWADFNQNIIYRKPHNYAPWKAIYKKETIPFFREDRKYGSEDIDFQNEIESDKYSKVYLDRVLYIYNSNREGSLIWKKQRGL